MITLKNEWLKAEINPLGAEYQSIIRVDTGIEYLWQGDPAWWGRRSPVLFPIVGKLRDGKYTYQGKEYALGGHGFARDMVFDIEEQSDTSVKLHVSSDEETRKVYPFEFDLYVTYTLEGKSITCDYEVINRTDGDMYFSIGAHPGINLPLLPGESWADYVIRFARKETCDTWCFRNGGMQWQTEPCLQDSDTLDITPHMFDEDAIILKDLVRHEVSFEGRTNGHRITCEFDRYPTIAFWSAAPNAPFVCMEPWCGHADMVDHDGDLTRKQDIEHLEKDGCFSVGYTLTLD